MKVRKTVTEKKLAANRRNSAGSTGARTERGKNTTRFNALKHGLFAKHMVIPMCDGAETNLEFGRLLADLRREHQPEGPSEDFLVDQIAGCMWKFRRATIAEKGSILDMIFRGEPETANARFLPNKKLGLLLRTALDEIKAKGTLSPENLEAVRPILEASHLDTAPDNLEASVRKCFAQKAKEFEQRWSSINEVMEKNFLASCALPPEMDMNAILRCETATQRKYDWALQRLLDCQQRRRKAKRQRASERSGVKRIAMLNSEAGR